MDAFEIKTVMDRNKVAGAVHTILDAGVNLLEKDKLEAPDFAKLKIMRNMSPALSSAVMMIQQETAQQRLAIVVERMKQLGYSEPKSIG
jgi:hypothetical protein